MLPRREFLLTLTAAAAGQTTGLRWQQAEGGLFEQASWNGLPRASRGAYGLLTAAWRLDGEQSWVRAGAAAGPVSSEYTHRLHRSGSGRGEDVLEAGLRLRNGGTRPVTVWFEFRSSAHPSPSLGRERAHLPLTAGGLLRHGLLRELGTEQLAECEQFPGRPGENGGPLVCHYREPGETEPEATETRALLLIPLVDLHHPGVDARLALFGSPERAWRIATEGIARGEGGWTARSRATLGPGEELTERFFLAVHPHDARAAWRLFHQYAHRDPLPRIGWLDEVRVHYYDFLGPATPETKRGGGFEADARHFREFGVGMATQHGYYPFFGDYLHPDRKQWTAMAADHHGGVPMSIEKMRARCALARAQGAKAMVYLHTAAFDAGSPRREEFRDAILVQRDGRRAIIDYWKGPDTVGELWHMSIAAPAWRAYLIEQARLIMELVQPDGIVLDESFGGLGYDHHPRRKTALSRHMIEFVRALRAALRSFGADKALVMSDCTLSSFTLWADGEGGDHAYRPLLGHEAYRREPVRYLAALGDKPWTPCAWQFTEFWPEQMDLARKTGAGVGVANGWIEYTGLAALPPAVREQILNDLRTLRAQSRRSA